MFRNLRRLGRKELCDKGLKPLFASGATRGSRQGLSEMNLNPWELPHRGAISRQQIKENPLISKAAVTARTLRISS